LGQQRVPVWSDESQRGSCLGIERCFGLGLVEREAVELVHRGEPAEEPFPPAGGDVLGLGFVVGDGEEVNDADTRLAPRPICSHGSVRKLVPVPHVDVVGLLRNRPRPHQVQPEPARSDRVARVPERWVRPLVRGHRDVDGREAVVLSSLRVDPAGPQALKNECERFVESIV
jgi:hypothetical protein